MALSSENRMDRRRRVLRDTIGAEGRSEYIPALNASEKKATDAPTQRRAASYSHSVRQACNVRLVQLIPVRLLSYAAVVLATLAVTSALLTAHYLIYVSATWQWYGHPMAIAFDATHPQGLAAWLGSHLWLLCLGSTLLIFQLRRHKLDDYKGEYRLWIWLVAACLLASIDSTTHLSELLGYSLDQWARTKLGWSGRAVVQATLSALIGVLGLRLCSELKTVPFSLIYWLLGLAMWAGSAVLAGEIFRFDLSVQMRVWLRAGLWLGGLAAIWLSALTYLRHVYIQAQQRFLLRGKQSNRNPSFTRNTFLKFINPFPSNNSGGHPSEAMGGKPAGPLKSFQKNKPADQEVVVTNPSRWSLKRLLGSVTLEEDAEEYQKVQRKSQNAGENSVERVPAAAKPTTSSAAATNTMTPSPAATQAAAVPEAQKADRSSQRAARRAAAVAKRLAQKELKKLAREQNPRNWNPRNWLKPIRWILGVPLLLKLPSLKGLKLNPPESDRDSSSPTPSGSAAGLRPVGSDRPLPTTVRDGMDSDTQSGDRNLSKAERKRLRRQDRAA